MAADEAPLLALARAGDRDAAEQILRLHMDRVQAVCRRICRDPHDAQDATQEALIAIARGLRTFDGRSALTTWIHRVTTNACLDELRRRRRRPEPVEPSEPQRQDHHELGPDDLVVGAELRGELAVVLADLPEEFRVAVVLRDVADLDYAAIAEITDVPVGTVRSRIARGRARLADALTPQATEAAGSGTEPGLASSDTHEAT